MTRPLVVRIVVFLILLCFVATLLPADDTEDTASDESDYEPYSASEFPQWALDLRRAEVIFFGSLPFTLLLSTLGFDSYNYVAHDFDTDYVPFYSTGSGEYLVDSEERTYRILAAVGGSLLLALVDYIIGASSGGR
ncbi:hypothetical protein [Sediminispirochaeta smaragdinae]|uniref:Uncharacterized protein n=1 Tax=Sediminispirochaeta smaragdinae (strain DSM 11293 / JCM 15392 / SEBR 4228) TaxID=573413 RepID=E1R3F4_SEDSS|nr:hypothetical protein [Sediminispirochaeta smaragdinae]ADK81585.1 conserved hypothetical protein [Sediminispirochaeta smaragdinae DSM 11293]